MRFDRKKFFEGFRKRLDETIEQEQVEGLEFLLGEMESDAHWRSIPEMAYALATVFHETATSFQPVEEGYYLGAAKAKRFQKGLRYYPWFGRGYVQLTWEKNYQRAKKALGVDFIADPDLVMKPINAYEIMTLGMHQGWFTGKKLSDYITASKTDYINARRIINGVDKAGLIAGYARSFEKILKDSAAEPADELTNGRSDQDTNANTNSANSDTASTPQPTDSLVTEAKTTEAQQQDGKTTVQEVTITTPKGDLPGARPTQVTQNGSLSKWIAGGGGLTAIGTAVWGFVTSHLDAIGIALICITLLIVVIIFRGAITDAIRMQTSADPDKNNVT